MRQFNEYTYLGRVDHDLLKRLYNVGQEAKEANNLFILGLESLMHHPLNKQGDIFLRVNFSSGGNGRCTGIEVYEYQSDISSWSIHQPSGDERSKLQLQVSYTYDVQNKRPRNVKRSCNPKVIKEMVQNIRSRPMDKQIKESIEELTGFVSTMSQVRAGMNKVNGFFRDLYYESQGNQVELLRGLIYGDVGKPGMLQNARESLSLYEKAKQLEELHRKHMVAVFASPTGKHKVFRHIVTDGRNDTLVDIFESRETLPDDIKGNLAVLDIAQSAKADDRPDCINVEGVGLISGPLLNLYYLIGENFVDPRIQGQEQGS
jgi:hypothetical protein